MKMKAKFNKVGLAHLRSALLLCECTRADSHKNTSISLTENRVEGRVDVARQSKQFATPEAWELVPCAVSERVGSDT
jgi:hypothetical protein